MTTRGRIGRIVAAGTTALLLAIGGTIAADAAYAAADAVTISPATSTAASNTLVTYTLTVTCSETPDCGDSSVTIPTTSLTGDGSTTDFGSWINAGTCTGALTRSPGQVSIAYPALGNGTSSCTITLRAPNKTTLDGAQVTLTPTLTTAGGSVTATTPAVLTLTAGHHDALTAGISGASVFSGAPLTLTFTFSCGTSVGDLGLSALSVANALPANFTFTGLTTAPTSSNLQGTITTPPVGSSGGTITYTGDGSDCADPANNRIVFTATGTASTSGTPDPVDAQICNTGATASFTYIDGFSDSATANGGCATVVDLDFQSSKSVSVATLGNGGQYTALDGSDPAYTFPGDWDGTGGDTTFTLHFATRPVTSNSGLSYAIQDPLPCIDNPTGTSGVAYTSNAPGVACAHPAFVPRTVTATGFTPAAGATIDLLYADGSSGTAAYVAGTGWTIPTSPAVSEIDFPAFPEEGSNFFANMTFVIAGYAASTAVAPDIARHILSNNATFTAYFSGTSTVVKAPHVQNASILVADAAESGASGTVEYPGLTTTLASTCTERVAFNSSTNGTLRNKIEIANAPSQAIYYDYLAPVGAGPITGSTLDFSFVGPGGRSYTAAGVAATQTSDYHGTGRTLLSWTIPANVITVPGVYLINPSGTLTVPLPAGCAGTYRNSLTMGYGAPVTECFWDNYTRAEFQQPPMADPDNPDPDLTDNGSPIEGNYCSYSDPLAVTPTNPGFSVNKSVQGDLDAAAVGGGGIGKVSPTGGTATYTVRFANTGLSNLHDPVMYDLLPRVGDTEATSTTARGSQFAVTLTDVATPPAGVTVSYSTATNPCRPEVLAVNPGCVDDWSTTPPSPLADTTALRIAYSGTVGVSGSPFPQSFDVSYTGSTPSTSVGNIAWNSVGTNVHVGDTGDPDDTTDLLGAAESALTGVTASSGVPAVVKGAGTSTFDQVGDTVTYTFDVTNNAEADLTSVAVVDAFTDAPAGATAPTVTCQSLSAPADTCSGPTTPLLAGQTAHFTATYTVTQADLDHGVLTDVATATGTSEAGGTISNTSNAVTVTAVADPDLVLEKTATPTTVTAAGQTVGYGFHVTNDGNQTVHALAIDDTAFSGSDALGAITCDDTILAPGADTDCHVDYTVTQADMDAVAATITNSATAGAVSATGTTVTSDADDATVTIDQNAALSLDKTASTTTVGAVGDPIVFDLVVTNTGNVTLTALAIDESGFQGVGALGAVDCPATTLLPGDDVTCTADYAVVQGDIDNGSIVNTATASATGPGGATANSAPSTAAVAVVQHALLQLTKTADVSKVTAAGQTIDYTFHIVNAGDVTVNGVGVTEGAFTGTGTAPTVDCSAAPTSLAPGADLDCTASYTVVGGDLRRSAIDNTAVAIGVTGAGSISSTASTAHVVVDPPEPGGLLARTGLAGAVAGIASGIGLIALGIGVGVVLLIRRRREA
jgi:hypothetical protein